MQSFNELINQGAANAWLFIPSAILLGALHGLEPGHSKTMMAAFIVAVRGTVWQAVLLGLSAAISHSFLIWVLAAGALKFGSHWNAETTEPYFQIVSGVIIVALAGWMFWRLRRDQVVATDHSHDHGHGHDGDGPHGGQVIDTGHGLVEVSVFETGVPPRFRLYFSDARKNPSKIPTGESVVVDTVRPDGAVESFAFVAGKGFLEAATELAEPHEFTGTLRLSHRNHSHGYEFVFTEHAHHDHEGLNVSDGGFQDAHERAHAADIARRFQNQNVTTGQIVLFGLTGGLLPCPAAFTVLLICLQLKQFVLGFTLVACFSLGLALTMVAAGVVAAWGVRHASKRFAGFNEFARKAPYFSSAVLTCLGIFIFIQGWLHLPAR